ncbi:HNH endonuclease [Streptomyces sp. H39-S7]|uniref:HNH endonuclease n=1 Tax=Streptomyces sp. H39-S7 TaxID=3004357 RepID=UPI0022B032B9|nr:HNH endonuclease [Streptomyces sp. H39-S7]MCZ4118851.1 HNH endonuclease [Streptomyces sp. H39-S7]
MSGHVNYPRDLLARTAPISSSLVDLLRRLNVPLRSGPYGYLRDRLRHYGIDTSHFTDEPLPERERRAYPRVLLEEAAACCHSIREMFEFMGYPPNDSPYSHIRTKLDRFGIDTSHFTSGVRYGGKSLPLDRLGPAVAKAVSLAGVLRHLGLPDNGGNRARVRSGIADYRLSCRHFTGQGHNRGKVSPKRRSAAEVLRHLETGSGRTKTTLLRRALDEVGVPHQCAACGVGDTWQGKRLVLEIDHSNGDRLDNRPKNLRYFCPSCHSQTETFARPKALR